jgi:ribosomal protein S18 acetylase RimI-like enzyme
MAAAPQPPPPLPATPPQIQALPATKIDEAAIVMADAFLDSPGYVYFLRGTPDFRRRALSWIMARNLRAVRRRDRAALRCVLAPDGAVVATYIVTARDGRPTYWDLVACGMLLVPLRFGAGVFARMRRVVAWFTAASRDAFVENEGDLLLERMTVRPDFQGRGVGTACVRHAAEEAAARGVALRLSTQETRNVALYGRLGFRVVFERDYVAEDPEFSFHAWFMELREEGEWVDGR